MNAQPTAWDRAHAKSCWARGSVATDVPTEMYRAARSGVFEAGVAFASASFEPTEIGRPRWPPLRTEWRLTQQPELGRYLGADWLPHGSENYWQVVFSERRENSHADAARASRPRHANPNTRREYYGFEYDYGRDRNVAAAYAAAARPPGPEATRDQVGAVPRHEDPNVPYDSLSKDEKSKRAKFYTERLKEVLKRRADAKRR